MFECVDRSKLFVVRNVRCLNEFDRGKVFVVRIVKCLDELGALRCLL